jgi:RimJ/RimL family protein N-acetyltransferase
LLFHSGGFVTFLFNEYQQPVGEPVADWLSRPRPQRVILEGRFCRLEPLSAAHSQSLWKAWRKAGDGRDWTYLGIGPFNHEQEFAGHITASAASEDPLHYTIIDSQSGHAMGTIALMRIDPVNGVVEVGFVVFSPELKRTVQASEAHYLLMKYAFDTLGYRRYEWKCDSLNGPSRRAALRLGFRYEGLFRQAIVYKGRTRDTAWFSILDGEWPQIRASFEAWLAAENMPQGRQLRSLSDLREEILGSGRRSPRTALNVRPLAEADFAAWHALWQGYLTFYDAALSEEVGLLTWQRMLDESEPMYALGAFDERQKLLGIVHMVYHRGTWSRADHCYLEDLFTDPQSRGKGVGRALIEAVYQHAQTNGSERVYWHTHETNATAQVLYDKLASKPGFIQYIKNMK